jgi:peptidoglycan/xylan/chitin deacetylase (PgdA/CDA1 family)
MLKTHGHYRYSPITQRPDYVWPNGMRLAVYFALGIEDYVFGAGLTEDILPGASKPDLVNTSWRDYGNRVGAFRLLEQFSSRGIRPAVLLNTTVYDSAPAVTDAARAIGAEFVGHGQTNSDTLATMSTEAESLYIAEVAARIKEHEGRAPKGWSSPWLAQSDRTLDLLKTHGFDYLLDLRLDDQPVWLETSAGRILSIPYGLEINDSSTIIGRQASAREFTQMIIDEFDELLRASAHQPLVMSVVVHSFISGQPFRLAAFKDALDHIVARRSDIWLCLPHEIAEVIGKSPGLAA